MFVIWYRLVPTLTNHFFTLFFLLAFLVSLGPAIWFSAINIKYRDFRFVVPFIVQFGLYISPVGFSSNIVPERWRFIFSLNPIVGLIDGFRWCIFGGQSKIYLPGVLRSVVVTAFFLWFGIHQFRKLEKRFADLM